MSKGCRDVSHVRRGDLASVEVASTASVSLWGASLLHLIHGSHYGLINLGTDFFDLALAVESASNGVVSLNELLEFSGELEILLVKERYMTFECLDLALELVLLFNKLRIDVFEVIDLPLESRDLVFSHLQSDSAIVLNVAEFFASKELLVVHLGQLILALHMLVVELLKVLDLRI